MYKNHGLYLLGFFLFSLPSLQAATVSISTSQNWSAITGGSGTNGVPNSSDVIQVTTSGVTLTVDVSNAACSTLTVNNGGIVAFNSGSQLTVSGTAVTLGAGGSGNQGTLDMTNGGTLKCRGLTSGNSSSTFTAGTGTVEFNGTGASINIAGSTNVATFYNLTINGSALSVSLGGAITINGNLNILTGTLDVSSSNYAITLKGDFSKSGTFTNRTGTVTLNGTSTQQISSAITITFSTLVVSNNAGVTTAANIIATTLTISSGAVLNPGASYTVDGGGNGTLTGAGTAKVTRTGNNVYTGQYPNFTTKTVTNVEFAGTSNQSIGATTFSSNNVTVSNSSGLTLAGALTINTNTLTISSGAYLDPSSSAYAVTGTGTLTGAGTVKVTKNGSDAFAGQYTISGKTLTSLTVEYAGSSSQTLTTAQTFGNLTINNSRGVTLSAAITVNGALALKAGTLSNGSNLTLGSGATIARTGGSLGSAPTYSGNVDVSYTGTADIAAGNELPTGSSALQSLTIGVSSGKIVTLSANATVNNSLTLTSGYVSVGSNTLTLPSSASLSGGSGSTYVRTNGSGYLKRTNVGTAPSTFPIGYNPYLPVIIQTTAGTADISINIHDGITDNSNTNVTTHAVNKVWEIIPSAGVSVNIAFQWDDADGVELTGFDRNSCAVFMRTGSNSGAWSLISPDYSAASVSGTIHTLTVSGVNLSSSTSYFFGISDNVVPLPVELIGFRVSRQDAHTALLCWITASEYNNRGFDIQSSSDGEDWESFAFVEGKCSSYSSSRYTYRYPIEPGNSVLYFRLCQKDMDGRIEYSPVRMLRPLLKDSSEVIVWPNPFRNLIHVAAPGNTIEVRLRNSSGAIVHKYKSSDYSAVSFDLSFLGLGIYSLEVISPSYIRAIKLIKY